MIEACSWRGDVCESPILFLWSLNSWLARLDIMALGLMLGYVIVVTFHVRHRCRFIRLSRLTVATDHRTSLARLNREVTGLRSIAWVAPYFGSVGVCAGILSAFRGAGMEKYTFLRMVESYLVAALIPSAAGILVASPATWLHNHLRRHIELVGLEISSDSSTDGRPPRSFRKFPLAPKLSLPPFAAIGTMGLAFSMVAYMILPSPYAARGFPVDIGLPFSICSPAGDRPIFLRLTNSGKTLLNSEQEDRRSLPGRLAEMYHLRRDGAIYLVADDDVLFQAVADAADIAENVPVDGANGTGKIRVRLVGSGGVPRCYQVATSN